MSLIQTQLGALAAFDLITGSLFLFAPAIFYGLLPSTAMCQLTGLTDLQPNPTRALELAIGVKMILMGIYPFIGARRSSVDIKDAALYGVSIYGAACVALAFLQPKRAGSVVLFESGLVHLAFGAWFGMAKEKAMVKKL